MDNHFAIIMAGGSGTRLWPLSRRDRPKQVLRLFGDRSLLRIAFDRLAAIIPPERIIVIAAQRHRAAILGDLVALPAENYIGEPEPRDTAAAVAVACAWVHRRDLDSVVGVFTADHVIEPLDAFRDAVQRGYRAAVEHPQALVTFGIRPSSPHTGYGYIQRGERIADPDARGNAGLSRVARFTEKPDRGNAERFVVGGEHLWNSGMFVWRVATILAELERHLPATHAAALAIAAEPTRMSAMYGVLQKISIDFAVMEKAREVLVVDMAVDWADVGSWPSLRNVLPADAAGNVTAASNVAVLDARNSVFVCEDGHLLAAIGMDDVVIIRSSDATLVCRAGEAERIKELLKRLEQEHGERYL